MLVALIATVFYALASLQEQLSSRSGCVSLVLGLPARLVGFYASALLLIHALFSTVSMGHHLDMGEVISKAHEEGTLQLRVVSIMTPITTILLMLRHRPIDPGGLRHAEVADAESLARIYRRSVFQFAFFHVVIGALWILQVNERARGTAIPAALATAMLFIADDWAIMAGYMRLTRGTLVSSHFVRVWVLNAAFLIGVPYALWQYCGATLANTAIFLMVVFLLLSIAPMREHYAESAM